MADAENSTAPRTLFLLRHAQALSTPAGGQDFDRKLSPKGIEDAQALGRHLKSKGYKPDFILCSSAQRTRQTCENIIEGYGKTFNVEYTKDLYSATRGQLLNKIQDVHPNIHSLMMIAHNPFIYELAAFLASSGSDHMLSRLSHGYEPATCTVFDAPFAGWYEIDPRRMVLKDIFSPIDYNAPERPTRWM